MIDVIVPVYAGEDETKRCLASLWAACCKSAHQIVVVDDCSPEPALSAWLDEQAADGRIDLIRHERNRGFVAAANAGMSRHPDRDVVLLNSDTEVANDWLDRIVVCADSSPNVGTVTPFSNNATICSYPFECWDGGLPGRLGLTELDRLFAGTLVGRVVDLPTAVGFCMFVRRACLNAVGLFDERVFGRGYGEENDFSLRAAKAGWRNVLAADVFVYHRGAVSFGEGRFAQMRRAEAALLQRHPDYNRRVQLFGAANSLAPLREAIDRARTATGPVEAAQVQLEHHRKRTGRRFESETVVSSGEISSEPRVNHFFGATPDQLQPSAHSCDRPALLHVAHSWGGGVDQWIHDYAAADDANWNLLLRSRTGRNAAGVRIELVDLASDDDLLLAWDLHEVIPGTAIAHRQYRELLDELIASFGVEALVLSSLIGHSLDLFDIDLPLVVVLHDLVPFCPALFGWFEKPCKSCERDDLIGCLSGNPLNLFWYQGDADQWLALREAYAIKLTKERLQIAAPSRSVFEHYAVLFPVLREISWVLVPHGINQAPLSFDAGAGGLDSTTGTGRQRLRLLIPARLAPHKGLDLFREILPQLVEFAEVLLLGCGDFGLPFDDLEHVTVVPAYVNTELAERVREFNPDCALLLSILPESFSYTLSEMWALGVPVLATSLGAFAERIEDGQDSFLVEPDGESVLTRLRELDRDRAELLRVANNLRSKPVRSARDMVDDYRGLLASSAEAGERLSPGSVAQAVVREAAARRFLSEDNARLGQRLAELTTGLKDLQMLFAGTEMRADAQEKRADAQEARADAQEKRADAQEARADAQEKRADAQEKRADAQQMRAEALTARAKLLEAQLAAEQQRTAALLVRIHAANAREQGILSSRSWQLTRPLRAASRLIGRDRVSRTPAVESESVVGRQGAGESEPLDSGVCRAPQPGELSVSASESDAHAELVVGAVTVELAGEPDKPSLEAIQIPGAESEPVIEVAPRPDIEPGNGVFTEPGSGSVAKVIPTAVPDSTDETPSSGAVDATVRADLDDNDGVQSESSSIVKAVSLVYSLPEAADAGVVGQGGSAERATTGDGAVGDVPAADTAAPLAEAEFVARMPHVEVESGNLLALAQAVWLEEALGLVDLFNDRSGDRVPEGFSLVLRVPAPQSVVRLTACFEGVEGMPEAAATELAMEADRILAPTTRLAQRYSELWPESSARISVGSFPAVLRQGSVGDLADLRVLQRKKIGVPDKTRLVLGVGLVGSRAGLVSFAQLAMQACEHRTDLRFVWIGARDPSWEGLHRPDVGLAVTLRRLFLVPDPNVFAWLLAADAYVGCRSAAVYDAAAVEALAAGLPVCVVDRATLPDELTSPPCSQWVTEARGTALIDWLDEEVPRAFVSTGDTREQRREQVTDYLNFAGLREQILSVFN